MTDTISNTQDLTESLKKLQEIESKFTAEIEKYKQEYSLAIKNILADIEKRKLDSVRGALKI